MHIGLMAGTMASGTFDDFAADARAAAGEGLHTWWISQILGFDALSLIGALAREVPGIRFGTAVVPIWPRHPMVMAQQALTASALAEGRFDLGIGLSHQPVIEGMMGIPWDRPLRQMREYLDVLVPLLSERAVAVKGEVVSCQVQVTVPDVPAPAVLVAALGPRMLALAGTRTDGTITWMTGPRTLAAHTVPRLREAAEEAGRPAPRVVGGYPICVTDDAEAARTRAARTFAMYGQLPSYRAMLEREGVAGPEEIAVVGDEAAVSQRLAEVAAAGATDLAAAPFGRPEEKARTLALLSSLAAKT